MRKLLMVLTLAIVSLMLTACSSFQKAPLLPEFENNYFKYAVETKQDGTKIGYLTGFTELGKTQTTLVLPSEIEGIPIMGIGYRRNLSLFGTEVISQFESQQLEKLYIPFEVTETYGWRWDYDFGNLPNCYITSWSDNALVRLGLVKGFIHTFHEYQNNPILLISDTQYSRKIANVSYMYNYEGAPNLGYYWIDSYHQSIISYIPEPPQRAGYVFDGWYRDPEFIHLWDFNVDQTGDEILLTGSNITNYTGVTLYAKWLSNLY